MFSITQSQWPIISWHTLLFDSPDEHIRIATIIQDLLLLLLVMGRVMMGEPREGNEINSVGG